MIIVKPKNKDKVVFPAGVSTKVDNAKVTVVDKDGDPATAWDTKTNQAVEVEPFDQLAIASVVKKVTPTSQDVNV